MVKITKHVENANVNKEKTTKPINNQFKNKKESKAIPAKKEEDDYMTYRPFAELFKKEEDKK